jgi:hypothetical protein
LNGSSQHNRPNLNEHRTQTPTGHQVAVHQM